jgi:hypothetical protein
MKPIPMKFVNLFSALLLMASCSGGYDTILVYELDIENSKKVIIDYQAWSTMNDGTKYGSTILNDGETLNICSADQEGFGYLIGVPKGDTIHSVKIKKGGGSNPRYISTNVSSYNGITFSTENYSYGNINSTKLSYSFSAFRETKDSLFILGIEKEYFKLPVAGSEIGFLKGNVRIVESDSLTGRVEQISIPNFLFKTYSQNTIDKLTLIQNDSLQISGLVLFVFEPTIPIYTNEFSNSGIFKRRIHNRSEICH